MSAYVLLFERNAKNAGEPSQAELAVWSLRGSEVYGLTLELGSSPIVLEKRDNRWQLNRPVVMEADGDTVESLLSQLEFLTAQRVIQGQRLDLAQYGLDHPSKKVRVKTAGGEQVLKLGSRTPIGKGMYVQVQEKPQVYVVAEGLEKSLAKNPEDLRNRVMMEFDTENVVHFALINVAGSFEVEKEKSPSGSTWKWKTPTKGKEVNQDAVGNVLWELRRLKSKKFLGEKSKTLWNEPLVKAVVSFKGKESPQTLWVGELLPDGSYLCAMEGSGNLFTLESYQVEPMKKDLASKPSQQLDSIMGQNVPSLVSTK